MHVLGRIPSTTSWVPLDTAEHAAEVPGVLVTLFATPLWYANADHFRIQLTAAVDRAGRALRLVVLDAIGRTDLDYTGSRVLAEALDELDRRGVSFAMARASKAVRDGLSRSRLLTRIGPDHLFASVGEAVEALRPPPPDDRGTGSAAPRP
ncbi:MULTISPECIES: sodium-independent anion transporter [unclassified Mycolicibacterium]|uniref:sodium-independent anion transporter n=1 Tax=unclassified Mycolicibacterium TaxID=2636767 RepID=UPI002EDB909F